MLSTATAGQRRLNVEQTFFWGIVAAFIGLSVMYGVITPAGEGVDEIPHLRFTLFVKANHALPVLPFVATPDTVLMGHHPPLYYVVAALLVAPLDTNDLDQALPPNPHFVWIEGYGSGNRNVFLHSPVSGTDAFPWHGVVLAIHLLRLASTAQGVVALLVARALLQRLLDGRTPLVLMATAATAFQPTFVSTFSLAHHDGTVAVLGLQGILWCVDVVRQAGRGKPGPPAVFGGVALGLALLTKTSALALGPVYLVALALVADRTRRWRRVLIDLATILLTAAVISGWWYARNAFLYGDALAQNVFAATHPTLLRTGSYQLGDVVAFLQQLRRTYWGSFGYMHVLVDQRVGDAFWLVAGIGGIAFAASLVARRNDRALLDVWAVGATAVAALLLLFIRYSFFVGGVGHGRFFVAIIPIVNGAVVLGYARLPIARLRLGAVAYAAGMVAFGALVPFLVIGPAYRPPLATSLEAHRMSSPQYEFGGRLAVAGEVTPLVAPGHTADVKLLWTTHQPIRSDLRFRLRVQARDGTTFFDKEYWPAGGGIPTYTWPADVTYRDTIEIPVPSNVAPGVARAQLSVRAVDGDWQDAQGARDVDAGRLAIGDVPIVASVPAESTPTAAVFGDRLSLVGFWISPRRAGEPLGVTLYWTARGPIETDEAISVQLLNAGGGLVAQHDGEPADGGAPTTTWPVGRIVQDAHEVALPDNLTPGDYHLILVVYDRSSLARLMITSGGPRQDYLDLGIARIP